MNLTVTYHHTTTDKFDIYQLQDMDKEEFNDGRCIGGIKYETNKNNYKRVNG